MTVMFYIYWDLFYDVDCIFSFKCSFLFLWHYTVLTLFHPPELSSISVTFVPSPASNCGQTPTCPRSWLHTLRCLHTWLGRIHPFSGFWSSHVYCWLPNVSSCALTMRTEQSFSSVSLIFYWAFPPWCPTIMSNPECSSFYSSLPSPSHTQKSFLCPISLPLSIIFILLGTESWDHLFSRISKFPQAFLFQSVLTARTWVQAFIPLYLNCCHSLPSSPTASCSVPHLL